MTLESLISGNGVVTGGTASGEKIGVIPTTEHVSCDVSDNFWRMAEKELKDTVKANYYSLDDIFRIMHVLDVDYCMVPITYTNASFSFGGVPCDIIKIDKQIRVKGKDIVFQPNALISTHEFHPIYDLSIEGEGETHTELYFFAR